MPRPSGTIPNEAFPASLQGQQISPDLGAERHNQPTVLDGYLMLTGNAVFSTWDISDPTSPVKLAEFAGQYGDGEAESHQVTLARVGDKFYAATVSGRGFDIWDLTDMRKPAHVSHLGIDGIDYGDVAASVWGLAWQGHHIYVGANDTGLHIVDVSDVSAPQLVDTLPNSATGGFFVGPVFAMGNILILSTPKRRGAIATMEISDPLNPILLDAVIEEESYIGWYYGGHVFLQWPLRIFDVLSDPTTITTVLPGLETVKTAYLSFADDRLYLGKSRPDPGAVVYDVSDLSAPVELYTVKGRDFNGNDDQFTIRAGNILVLSDDQHHDFGFGTSFLAVDAAEPDETPPRVNGIWPPDGFNVPPTSAVGVSFTDQIELATVSEASFFVRNVDGDCVAGSWGHSRTIVNFTPDAPFESDTTYELVLSAGGITDLAGNAIAEEYRSTFHVL